jgi:hypothetical protein
VIIGCNLRTQDTFKFICVDAYRLRDEFGIVGAMVGGITGTQLHECTFPDAAD